MKSVNEIREAFLRFFEENGHRRVHSSPLVPESDPTLLFVNSGMVQFKNVFTGAETRDYKRATTAQKCVRAGGKHNDLENVGYTARHLTFFEMLGNFSFGDYFKEEAIRLAWKLVTEVFELPEERLLVSVYHTDDEAARIWREVIGLPDKKILRMANDNFWSMGDTGPCGPCSEIFYDYGPHVPGGLPGEEDEGDRYVEIWNLVFMQYEQHADGSRNNLPAPCVDTGMGIERMASVLQGKNSVFDTDILRTLVDRVGALTDVDPDGDQAPSHRVIADHLRSAVFLMTDGVMPSNEGRGYVLRRIMRRGMRHAHLLGAQEPLMHKLVPTLTGLMGDAYPEVLQSESMVTELLRQEEERFQKTLARGLKLLEEEKQKLGEGQDLPGEVAFKLYDTYGFPLDLTQDALRHEGIGVDLEGFEAAMERQREQARASWAGSGDAASDKFWFDIRSEFGSTEFLGYETTHAQGQVLALIKDGAKVDKAESGDALWLVTNQTPFYGESGGQVGDTGDMTGENGAKLRVLDTRKKAETVTAHHVVIDEGNVTNGETVNQTVDKQRRHHIRVHHSVTHLMHEALRRVLGDHVAQKGSYQDHERTRFDISHTAVITDEEIAQIEDMVNREIRNDTAVETRVLPLEEAQEMGARALFGEKYGDEVRVVSMGSLPEGANKPFSVELCGGTHVNRTGEIGLFKIVEQTSVSAGVRRLEAFAGAAALDYLNAQERRVKEAAGALKTSPGDLVGRLQSVVEERKQLENEVSSLRRKLATAGGGADSEGSGPQVRQIGAYKFTGQVLDGVPPKELKGMADDLKKQLGSGIITLVATNEGKASIVVAVTDDLTDNISAVDLVQVGAQALGGKGGGGRPDLAQAGGPDAGAANDAVAAIENTLTG